MSATFDTLMSGNGDEPDSVYGLVARAVRYSADKLTYRFLLRPEARFSDGSKLTAADVAFSLDVLKEKAHPTYSQLLSEVDERRAPRRKTSRWCVSSRGAAATRISIVVGMPIFSAAWWKGRDFDAATLEAPLGSGPYRVKTFEQGRFIEFELDPGYWAKDLPVNVGANNFQRLRFEYYRERQVAFEAFKAGAINFHQEYTSRIWATGYDFAAVNDGRVKKEAVHNGAPTGSQGWYFNTRREQFKDPRVREALGLCLRLRVDEQERDVFVLQARGLLFPELRDGGGRPAGPRRARHPRTAARQGLPDSVFGEPYMPPVSDGSGSDRALLRRANDMLLAAGCKREGGVLRLPSGKPFAIEFLDSSDIFQPHVGPFQQNLKKLGIDAHSRIVDAAQYKSRTESFDFDVVASAFGGAVTPGAELRVFFSSKAATMVGSRNLAGVADPVVDALVEKIVHATTRAELNATCRALDRVLRAGHYWVPMWYNDAAWLAYWDAFSRPERQPKLGVGAPDTWWWDEEKAKKIGL